MTSTEDRLREAFADAAQTVRAETLRPLTVTKPPRRQWAVPLVAAASVGTLIAGVFVLLGTGVRQATVANPPAASAPALTAVRVAHGVVKITVTAPGCSRTTAGSGFVYAPQRVMTNAHVVAGARGPVEVRIPADSARHRATVVLYDPRRDVAVLAVPGLRAPALAFTATGAARASAVIAGYPRNASALRRTPAAIRGRHYASGPDIYGSSTRVTREIFAIKGTVTLGESGGPLLAPDGTVYGMVFAAGLDAKDTAYALTTNEIRHDAQLGRSANRRVSTRGCSR
jgi:S1-C subfamily serine protease